jgi:hypothetical protein
MKNEKRIKLTNDCIEVAEGFQMVYYNNQQMAYSTYGFAGIVTNYINSKEIEYNYLDVDLTMVNNFDKVMFVDTQDLLESILIGDILHIKHSIYEGYFEQLQGDAVYVIKGIEGDELIVDEYKSVYQAYRARDKYLT